VLRAADAAGRLSSKGVFTSRHLLQHYARHQRSRASSQMLYGHAEMLGKHRLFVAVKEYDGSQFETVRCPIFPRIPYSTWVVSVSRKHEAYWLSAMQSVKSYKALSASASSAR
jgi:hypothetical protein